MADISAFPITKAFPPKNPAIFQFYSYPTPNGKKVSAMLEETGLAYEAHLIRLSGDQKSDEFLALNPNGKIPAILDPDGPGGLPLALFESAAILIYLSDKSGGQFIGSNETERYTVLQWLSFQVGHVGPMFGQFGQYKEPTNTDLGEKDPHERYAGESRRIMGVLDGALAGKSYLVGEAYSIADMAIWPWVAGVRDFYEASDKLDLTSSKNVSAWLERCEERPASRKAAKIPDPDA